MTKNIGRLSGKASLVLAKLRTAASRETVRRDADGTWRSVCLATARPQGFSFSAFTDTLDDLERRGVYIAADDSAFGLVFFNWNAPGLPTPPKPRAKPGRKVAFH